MVGRGMGFIQQFCRFSEEQAVCAVRDLPKDVGHSGGPAVPLVAQEQACLNVGG